PRMKRIIWCVLMLLLHTRVSAQSQPRRPSFTCGGNVTADSGLIGSEGYPGVYPPNTKCVWKITVPEGKVAVLRFGFIDLESDSLCRYDYVDVYSGHSSGHRLGRFCGTFRPGALVSSSNKMLVQMVSDANTAGSGFIAMYSSAEPNERGDQYCGGHLYKPSGSFKTPNWPDKDYPAGVSCSWHIVAPKNQIIEVKFEKFDVERDNYCRYDYVAVFNGGEINDARRIGKYCGDSPPPPIFSDGNELLIQFLSDLSLTADGFIGYYKFRPKKYPTMTAPPVMTTTLATTRATRPIKSQKVKKNVYKPKPTVPYQINTISLAATKSESPFSIPIVFSAAQPCINTKYNTIYKIAYPQAITEIFLQPLKSLCQQKCKRSGTPESNYCSSSFVITGTVITAVTRGGSMFATVSIINVYKEGNLAIQQAGKNMSTKIHILCKKCPFVRRGLNYLFMGQADEEGYGKIAPNNFVVAFKAKNQRLLNNLKNKRCPVV
uniref:Procollagen C-endopeptidase enhancer 2b n=1 Tax=Lepisosteus oculatus TaxID=7918 RepID=W5MMD9_LEPOC